MTPGARGRGLLLAVAVGFPYIAYQIYAFVAPGLYKNERAAILPYLLLVLILIFRPKGLFGTREG